MKVKRVFALKEPNKGLLGSAMVEVAEGIQVNVRVGLSKEGKHYAALPSRMGTNNKRYNEVYADPDQFTAIRKAAIEAVLAKAASEIPTA